VAPINREGTRMQQLYPVHRAMELEDLHTGLTLPTGQDRAFVAIDMVASIDGAAAVNGQTAQLGGEADQLIFRRLRAAADAILVGAGTVRDEDYGPATGTPARRRDRAARGLAERPRLVVVSRSLDLDPGRRVFADPQHPPLVVTTEMAPHDRAASLSEVAEVVRMGRDSVALAALLVDLQARGLSRVLCEGGPTLNAALLAADLIDEVFLTIAPGAFGGEAPRIIAGGKAVPERGFELVSLHEHHSELLLRYRRAR
jgi:riboflavin-specific deaminase-like protein